MCSTTSCHNWIWEDKIQVRYTCRHCRAAWQQPLHGYVTKAQTYRWQTRKTRSLTPPPGLAHNRPPKPSKLQKNAAEILAPAWESMDDNMKAKLTELGINPVPKPSEPDLTDVLKENLTSLPAPVKELVERITKPQLESEKEMAAKLKQQVSTLRDISHRKQVLQQKIDSTKKHYQDILQKKAPSGQA